MSWVATSHWRIGGFLRLLQDHPRDCTLVSPCGGRVTLHSLLLTLHSPLLASLMEGGRQAISLPLPLTTLTTLVSIMYGGVEDNARMVQKEAANLGINLITSDEKESNEETGKIKHEPQVTSEEGYFGENVSDLMKEETRFENGKWDIQESDISLSLGTKKGRGRPIKGDKEQKLLKMGHR